MENEIVTPHDFFVAYGINKPDVEANVIKRLHDEGYRDSIIVKALTNPDAIYPKRLLDSELEDLLVEQVTGPEDEEPEKERYDFSERGYTLGDSPWKAFYSLRIENDNKLLESITKQLRQEGYTDKGIAYGMGRGRFAISNAIGTKELRETIIEQVRKNARTIKQWEEYNKIHNA